MKRLAYLRRYAPTCQVFETNPAAVFCYTAPMIIEFSGKIWQWRGPAPFYFVTVPARESDDLKHIAGSVTYGWGMVPVRARIGRTEWTTSLWPKDGAYVVPLKDAIRKAEQLDEGDLVTVRLEVR